MPFTSVLTLNKWGILFANYSACKIAPRTPWKCVMCTALQLLLLSLYWCWCRSSDLLQMTLDFFFGGFAWKKKKQNRRNLLSSTSSVVLLCSYRSLCVQDPVPLTFKSCVIAKDCETSEWSAWSACSRTCGWGDLAPGFRSRRRGVRSVAVGTGKQCPELEEREACSVGGKELLQPCPRYSKCF